MRLTLSAVLWFAVLGFFPALAQSAEYSADVQTTAAGRVTPGKISVSGDKTRLEMLGFVMITRKDLSKVFFVSPDQMSYAERPFNVKTSEENRVSVGKEELNGMTFEKFEVVEDIPNGPQRRLYQWVDAEGILVREETQDGTWKREYTNITTGPQSEGSFEVPEGYRQTENPPLPRPALSMSR